MQPTTIVVTVRCGEMDRGRRCNALCGEVEIYPRDGTVLFRGTLSQPLDSARQYSDEDDPPDLAPGHSWADYKRRTNEGWRIAGSRNDLWYLVDGTGDDYVDPDEWMMPDTLLLACVRERHRDLVLHRSEVEEAWARFRRQPVSGPVVIAVTKHHPPST